MKALRLKATLLALAAVLGAGLLAAVLVAAAGPRLSLTVAAATKNNSPTPYCDSLVGHLASNLGKSESDVKNAISKAIDQTLADAVKKGDLTQDQANKINSRISQNGGACPALGGLRRPFAPGYGLGLRGLFSFGVDAAGAALHISTAELKQDIAKGMTLHQIADLKGVSEDQFKAAVKAGLTPKLDQAVQSGKLTKDQENPILARVDQTVNMLWDRSLMHSKRATSGL